jgi:hypothetical protein
LDVGLSPDGAGWLCDQVLAGWAGGRALQAQLQAELAELRALPRTREVKQRLSEVQGELRQYRPPDAAWWRLW